MIRRPKAVDVDPQQPTKKTDKVIIPSLDFSKYLKNNWLKVNDNTTLNKIAKKGGAIWLNTDGELSYRFSENSEVIVNVVSKANTVFTNFLNKDTKLIAGTKDNQADVSAKDLHLIHKDDFRPHTLKEFYEHKGLWYKNSFEPTYYMKLNTKTADEPKVILSLINHLANNDNERYHYILNWLAYFFTGLKKSQVSLVLRGNQGAGKGILFENIIKPLFGRKYCIQVNDKSLNTNFLGGIVEDKLFMNLNEISHNVAGNKNIKNFLKDLVTSTGITAEKKNITMKGETKIHGQILITSNEPYILEVETSDRRYTVFTTGDNLSNANFLGLNTYSNFANSVKAELESFSMFLKSYNVDVALANKALDTTEKRALVNATNDKFKLFVNAIENKDIVFFEELEEYNNSLLIELVKDFDKSRIDKSNLIKYFNYTFDEEIHARALMNRLRAIAPALFDNKNISKSNGNKYYSI